MPQKAKSDFQRLKSKLTMRRQQAIKKLSRSHQEAWEYLTQAEVPLNEVGKQTTRLAVGGAVVSGLMLGQPTDLVPLQPTTTHLISSPLDENDQEGKPKQLKKLLSWQLSLVLPSKVRPLQHKEEQEVTRIISSTLGVRAVAKLDGYRLNTNFGMMGKEQHLLRYPKDSASQHDEFTQAGIAPKTPAWSYFVTDKSQLSDKIIQQEKYYVAVQTFLSPGWSNNSLKQKEWFKYRKVLVVNPRTGDAVVSVIGDAGPAIWTGKQFGGSPEVIHYLNLTTGKGAVLLFFIDDPDDKISLGPVKSTQNPTLK